MSDTNSTDADDRPAKPGFLVQQQAPQGFLQNLTDLLSTEQLHQLFFTSNPGLNGEPANNFGSVALEREIDRVMDTAAAHAHAKSGIYQRAAAVDPNFQARPPYTEGMVADVMEPIRVAVYSHMLRKSDELEAALPSVGLTTEQIAQLPRDADGKITQLSREHACDVLLDNYFWPRAQQACGMPAAREAASGRY